MVRYCDFLKMYIFITNLDTSLQTINAANTTTIEKPVFPIIIIQ